MSNIINIFFEFTRLNHFKPVFVVWYPALWCMLVNGYVSHIAYPSLMLFMLVILMIVGGCIYNDFIDCEYDKQCARTSIRPLAANKMSKLWVLICIPIFASVFFLTNYFFDPSILIYILISLILTLFYPFAKRVIDTPQLVLGSVNLTPLIGYKVSTIYSSFNLSAFSFYIIAVLWITLYDTLYAWNDIEDDKKLNLGNLGLLLGSQYMPFFIDIIWFLIASILFLNLSYTSPYSYTLFTYIIAVGMVQKSRFIKGYTKGVSKNFCHPAFVGFIITVLLFWHRGLLCIV